MTKVNYYSIYSDYHNCLLEDDDAYLLQNKIKKILKRTSQEGRLKVEPIKIEMISELEGEHEHYSDDEINEEAIGAIPEEFGSMGELYMISDSLLSVLEEAGVNSFKAHPIYLSHSYTKRHWTYWYLIFANHQYLPLITGKDLCFYDKEGLTVCFATSVIDNIKNAPIKNLTFEKHELAICQAVPMSSVRDVSSLVLAELEQLFIHKKPRVNKDSFYSIDYFLRKLKEKFSDISATKIVEIIESNGEQKFETKENESIRVKPNSLLYKELFVQRNS